MVIDNESPMEGRSHKQSRNPADTKLYRPPVRMRAPARRMATMSSFPGGRSRVLRSTGKLVLIQAMIVSGCVIFLGVGGSASASSGSSSPGFMRADVLGSNEVPSGFSKIGSVPESQRVSFDVVLAPSHSAELDGLMSALYDPSSSEYHQWLQAGQFDQRFGPSKSEILETQGWLRS